MTFTPLHLHSYYSFLSGLPSPADLAQAGAKAGMRALALTDQQGLTGAVEFYEACRAVGLQPILGLELPIRAPVSDLEAGSDPLVLLATDLAGWASLCRLSSARLTQADESPVPFEHVAANAAGLLCLAGGTRGLLTQLASTHSPQADVYLRRLADVFSDRLYVLLEKHTAEDAGRVAALAALARQTSTAMVAAHAVFYLQPEQARLQRLATAMRLNQPLNDVPDDLAAPLGACWLTNEQLAERFADFPEALAATNAIAERCRLELPLGQPRYPEVPLPPGVTAESALREKAEVGARQIYGDINHELRERLDHELSVITTRGYAPLFLIMEEVLRHARQTGVPISSRGSAASSLVAHCLGITTPDPIRLNLYFERFLNPARATPPDIDTDLCSRRRDGVIRHVYDTYGADRVAMVGTINRFRERSALRETAKAHGLPSTEVKALADTLPYRGWGPPSTRSVDADASGGPYAELAAQYPQHAAVFADAAAMLGLPRHLSVHPGGVVISPGPLTDLVPIQLASKGITITQFDLDSVARLGLVKIDLLGIRGLTVLGDVAEAHRPSGVGIAASPLATLDSIPGDDADTKVLLKACRTIGCFQIESPGMRAILKEVQAESIDDLMVALALFRPGPLMGGLKDAFVRRHLKQESSRHLHPALAPLLDDTYGVILYQEQVLRIAHQLAGLSLAEADLLRRAMSHFDPGKQMQTLKENFMRGAQEKSGVPLEIGERVWELMAAFAGYGFPKAHAASYALVAWRSAWCKAHFPAEFMASVLANWGGFYSQRVYLTEARRLGLPIGPPHINHAQKEFSVARLDDVPTLFVGLDQVKDLTHRTQDRILRERPFRSLNDFLARADPRLQEAENLVRVGALEGLGRIPALLRELKAGDRAPGQFALFEAPAVDDADWSLAEQVAAQEELLGASVAAHPLELMADKITRAQALTTVGAAARLGQRVRVAGMRQTWRRFAALRRGEYVYVMTLEDLDGQLEVVIAGEVYRRYKAALTTSGPYVIEGVVELDSARSEPGIRAEKIWSVAD